MRFATYLFLLLACPVFSAEPAYDWRSRADDPDRIYLYRDGKQIGGWCYRAKHYRPFDGATWGPASDTSPVRPPELIIPRKSLMHDDMVGSVSWSPDATTLASASADKTVKLWDAATGKEQATLKGQEYVISVSWSPDGKSVTSVSWDGMIKLWDPATGKERASLTLSTSWMLWCVSWSPDGKTLASGIGDQTVKLWDAATGKELATLKGHRVRFFSEGGLFETKWSLSWSPDGKTLASGSDDRTVILWDVAAGKARATLKGHIGAVHSLSWSPDGKTVASGSDDKTVMLWDVGTGKQLAILKGHSDAVSSLSWSPDGKTMASASGDKTVKLWDAATGRQMAILKGHTDGVTSMSWSPDGKTLASASTDKTVKLWDVSLKK